jgi:hypothetical protein
VAQLAEMDSLDRHGLVMAIWTPAGLIAATLYHYGLGAGGAGATIAAFAVIIVAFISHILVNAVSETWFTTRELALGLTIFGVALVAFVGATILSHGFAERAFLPTCIGFLAIVIAVVSYLILAHGLRSAFEAFDAIRSFSARDMADKNGHRRRAR